MTTLFPRTLSNTAPFSRVALALFIPVLAVKTLMGFNFSGANPFVDVAEILRTVDAIPLDRMPPDAARAIMGASAAWGAALFTLCVFGWIVVIRYRSALPLAIGLVLLEQLMRTAPASIRALATLSAGGPLSMGALINLALSGLLIVAFLAAFTTPRSRSAA